MCEKLNRTYKRKFTSIGRQISTWIMTTARSGYVGDTLQRAVLRVFINLLIPRTGDFLPNENNAKHLHNDLATILRNYA